MIIYPTGYTPGGAADAPTAAETYSCVADNSYPKIVGDLQNDFIQYGADIDSTNGNTLICGYAEAGAFPNSYWAESSQVAMNLMSDLNGQIFWAYTVTNILTSSVDYSNNNLAYRQCSISDSLASPSIDSYVYSLLVIERDNSLVIVKQNYGHGTYIYAKLIPGEYSGD